MIAITVNGELRELDVAEDTPLLWVLRDHLGLSGVKYGCGIGQCAVCTVHVDGAPVSSCVISVGSVAGKTITTIEGMVGAVADALRQAWIHEQVPQCGYCQPGQLMTAAALLTEHPQPTDEQITAAMDRVLCRCGTYQRVRKAIHRAASPVVEEV